MAKDTAVVVVQKQANPLIAKAEKLTIASPKDVEAAAELLSQLNKVSDAAEEEKQKVLKPLNAARTAELKRWKPLETVFGTAIDAVRRKMTVYQTEQQAIADKKAADIANRVGEGRGKLLPETAVRKMEEIEKPAGTVAADSGTVQFVPHPVVDITPLCQVDLKALFDHFEFLVTSELIVWDEVAVRHHVLETKSDALPGTAYRIEQRPKNFR